MLKGCIGQSEIDSFHLAILWELQAIIGVQTIDGTILLFRFKMKDSSRDNYFQEGGGDEYDSDSFYSCSIIRSPIEKYAMLIRNMPICNADSKYAHQVHIWSQETQRWNWSQRNKWDSSIKIETVCHQIDRIKLSCVKRTH